MASHATCFLRRLGMDLPFPGLGFRIDWGFGGSIQGFWGRAYPPLPYRPKPNSKPAPTQTLGLREGRAGPSPETWIDPLAPREGWVGVEKTGTDPCHPSFAWLRVWAACLSVPHENEQFSIRVNFVPTTHIQTTENVELKTADPCNWIAWPLACVGRWLLRGNNWYLSQALTLFVF